ncbi:hypothetical protein [Desulfonauticus submarinus]|uniref:Uncharacterized protein n=1 Tax=Desulfonauticus submarinus TaxID=206665 RepID=A0A1H0FQ30_9BACT|nr:hypothetical protein [Desulfonauticus submarinus]SDN96641.1 hypothetical protein SAMN04488516_11348 [Desulfonauticus submarinus]
MDIHIIEPDIALPTLRAFMVKMTLFSFKGRKGVEVHLYRSFWPKEEEKDFLWENILEDTDLPKPKLQDAKDIVLESFLPEERDMLIDYLKSRYESRIKEIISAPLEFPIPSGLVPLWKMPEDENFGRIYLDRAPNYSLPFKVRGFYDLNSAPPLMDEK